jgi:hypothetical protein
MEERTHTENLRIALSDDTAQDGATSFTERDKVCGQINGATLLSCIDKYVQFTLENGSKYGDDDGTVARQSLNDVNNLIMGRCEGDIGKYFSNNPELQSAIRDIENNNEMRFVVSFHSSWYDDLPEWKKCFTKSYGDVDYIAFKGENGDNSTVISTSFTFMCDAFQAEKGNATSACGCDLIKKNKTQ